MAKLSKSEWLIPAGLVLLNIVPMLAGAVRLSQISQGQITPENARFLEAPVSAVIHIVSVVVFGVLGAFQFAPEFRRRHLGWHRVSGRLVAVMGLAAALSGLWMTLTYPPAEFDGPALYTIRLIVGIAVTVFICLGVAAILRRDRLTHSNWMIRSYALAMGAGTQVLTHIPWLLFPSIHGEFMRAVLMGSGWGINFLIAERIIARSSKN